MKKMHPLFLRRTELFLCIPFKTIILLLLFLGGTLRAQIFTKLTNPVYSGQSSGAGWIDYNQDGNLDAYLTYFNSFSRLYSGSENGGFQLINNGDIAPPGNNYSGIGWGDFNNDGKPDLYLTSMNKTPVFYKNLGDGHFEKILNSPVTTVVQTSLSCNWIDFDNDGFLDLFITASGVGFTPGNGYLNLLFKNNGDETFTRITNNIIASQATHSSSAGFADFDNDGDQDVFMTEWGKDNWLFENDGEGNYTNNSGKAVNANTNISITCSWGDYDNDGYLDLFVGNGSTGSTVKQDSYLFHNNGDKTFTKIETGEIAEYRGCIWTSAWGDVDNDGDLDLYLGTIFETEEPLFINNGDGTFTASHDFAVNTTQDGTGITGASFGDYDNDGHLDLLVADAQGEGPFIYKNNGNNNNWLNITCTGSISNKSAIGARVKIKATIYGKTFWQIREIHGVNGFRGSDDLRVHFGLGDAETIDSLVVIWPSKQTSVLTDIPVNQFISITESIPRDFLRINFKADVRSGYSPLEVQFTDLSLSSEELPITSWSWDFDGDGVEDSDLKNPVYVYDIYDGKECTISLTVSTGEKSETMTKENFIKIAAAYEENLALNKTITASSVRANRNAPYKANDGSGTSMWRSAETDTQWVQLDLGSVYTIGKITIKWNADYALKYSVFCSDDTLTWNALCNIENGQGQKEEIELSSLQTRYIKLVASQSSTNDGYGIYEIEIYRPRSITELGEKSEDIPDGFSLSQNYPNPFNPVTNINYTIPSDSYVTLKVFDLLGKEIQVLVDKEQLRGNYEIQFNAGRLASGLYIYRITAGMFTDSKKLLLLK